MSVGSRRSELEIIRDILQMGSARITVLRYGVSLSHAQVQKYLGFMEKNGLIEVERNSTRFLGFNTTQRGKQTLQLMDSVFELIGLDDLNA